MAQKGAGPLLSRGPSAAWTFSAGINTECAHRSGLLQVQSPCFRNHQCYAPLLPQSCPAGFTRNKCQIHNMHQQCAGNAVQYRTEDVHTLISCCGRHTPAQQLSATIAAYYGESEGLNTALSLSQSTRRPPDVLGDGRVRTTMMSVRSYRQARCLEMPHFHWPSAKWGHPRSQTSRSPAVVVL